MRKPSLSILGLVLILIASLALPSAVAGGKGGTYRIPSSPPEKLKPAQGGTAAAGGKPSRKRHARRSRPIEELESGQAITRKIWSDTHFVFEGKTGEVVTLKVTGKAPGVDPHVTLLDPESKREAFDDDSGGHGNSLMKDHTLKQSGRYTAVVGVAGSDGGEVEILLEKAGR